MHLILPLAVAALLALLLTLAFTPVCTAASKRLGWVDHPDFRKFHGTPVPRIGGVAIFLGYSAGLGLLCALPITGPYSVGWLLPGVVALLPAILVIFATGLLDDLLGLAPWMKILAQVVAGALACNANVQIRAIAGFSIGHTWWHIPLTIFWLVACTNAFNLIDGLDGLAAGVAIFATATAFISGIVSGNTELTLVTAPLLGALLGFLPYNFNPASIFMGDCGSLTLGILLGCFGVTWSQKSATVLGMTAPLIALAIPLLDTSLAIARRYLRGRPVFGADRGHMHHRLLARGLTPRRVAFVFYAFAGIGAAFAILLSSVGNHAGGVLLIAFCVIVWFAVQYLGYDEFDAARRMIFGGLFLRVLNGRLVIRDLEHSVRRAQTVEDCWDAVLDASRTLGFLDASLQLPDRKLTACLHETGPTECWFITIPLNGVGHLDLSVPFSSPHPPTAIGSLVASIRTAFSPKLHAILKSDAAQRRGVHAA